MPGPAGRRRSPWSQWGAPNPDNVYDRPQGAHGAHRYSLADTGLDEARERERFRRFQAAYDVPDEAS